MPAEPRASLWRRYRRLQRDPVYDGVITGLGLAGFVLVLQPFHDDLVNLVGGLSLPVGLGLIGWSTKRADKRAEQETSGTLKR